MHSVCPHDCPSCCSLEVDVVDGRIADVTGTPGHPFTQGVICGKVREYAERVHSPLRVLTPLRRVGAKGEGRFERISWDDAVAEIARRWRGIIADHGGEAILPFSYAGSMGQVQFYAGHPLFHALGASRLDRSICVSTAYTGWRATVGQVTGNDSEQMVGADLVVLWGVNAAYSTINVMTLVKQARQAGAHVVVIDPYRTPTAVQGDEHLPVRPGSDGALALAVMHVLIGEGLVDCEYVGRALTDRDMAPPVKTLYVYSSNPAAVCPNQTLVLRGLAREDLFTVVHEQVMTDTAHYADLVLPATTSMEHADLYRSFGHFYFQYAEPVIAPQGEARSNWDVFAALARALGVATDHYARGHDAALRNALAGGAPHVSAITLERLKREPSVRLALPRPYMPFAEGAPTPSGKVEFVSASLAAPGLPALPTWAPLAAGPQPAAPARPAAGAAAAPAGATPRAPRGATPLAAGLRRRARGARPAPAWRRPRHRAPHRPHPARRRPYATAIATTPPWASVGPGRPC